jgi:glutathione S-transferase
VKLASLYSLRGKQYLVGAFTAADAYLFAVASWAWYVALDLSSCVDLLDYLKRVAARPAVCQSAGRGLLQ